MNRLKGKIALITGAARGMGAEHARMMVAEGARVVIGDVLDAEAQALAVELGEAATAIHLDVTDLTQWEAAASHAVQTFGGLHVLVNNAGIANMAPITSFDVALWRKTIDINLTGTFLGIRACAPAIIQSGGGAIINISSVEGLRGSAGLHAYVASKFGVRGLTKSAALDLAAHGVRVNSIHPGFVDTPMTRNLDPSMLQIPLGRGAAPSEVAQMVVFFASEESAYCTGSEFVIDGGLTSAIPHNATLPAHQ